MLDFRDGGAAGGFGFRFRLWALGLDFDVEMEENELEEGEARYYKGEDNEGTDPEIALSYIVRVSSRVLHQIWIF